MDDARTTFSVAAPTAAEVRPRWQSKVFPGISEVRVVGVALAGIFLLGLALRLNCLDCYSLWYDEIISLETAQRGSDGIFGYRFGWVGNQTPLHYMLVWLGAQIADPVETSIWVRIFSASAGALSTLVVYGIGQILFSRAHGLVSALLFAITPTLLDYSQDIRPYSMLTFLTLLSIFCLLRAARGGNALLWVGFAVSTVFNLLNSFVALTMVMPSLLLLAMWLGWKLWRERRTAGGGDRRLLYLVLSLVPIAIVTIAALLETARVPRYSAGVTSLGLAEVLSLLIVLVEWFTQLDVGGQLERVLQMWMLLMALVGVIIAIRGGKREGALVCVLFIVVPWFTMAYFMARFYVTQRYVLFVIPFYLMLIAYSLVRLFELVRESPSGERQLRVSRLVLAATFIPAIITIPIFAVGALNYASVDSVGRVPYRADFRTATQYLQIRAGPDDVIVFVDHNALGLTSAQFYWRGKPPAPAYDARDPRLALHVNKGDIFWVFSSLGPEMTAQISAQEQGWDASAAFAHGVAVTQERATEADMSANLERMVQRLLAMSPKSGAFILLQGCVQQARGEIEEAASHFRTASRTANKVLGNEFLRTAQGFAERGNKEEAWREAALSRYMWSANPALHTWLAKELAQAGYTDLSRTEAELAILLKDEK